MQAIALPSMHSIRALAAAIVAAAALVALLVIASVHFAGGPTTAAKTQVGPAPATSPTTVPLNCYHGRAC